VEYLYLGIAAGKESSICYSRKLAETYPSRFGKKKDQSVLKSSKSKPAWRIWPKTNEDGKGRRIPESCV